MSNKRYSGRSALVLMAGCALAAALATTPASARGGGGGGMGGMGMHGGMGMGGMSGMNGNFGGNSASHISTQGTLNTNGPNAATRTFGADRASERENIHATQQNSSADADAASDTDTDVDTTGRTQTHLGGQSSSHISSQGLINTNGPNAAKRLHGLDRANARMSAQGLAHSKARAHANSSASDSNSF